MQLHCMCCSLNQHVDETIPSRRGDRGTSGESCGRGGERYAASSLLKLGLRTGLMGEFLLLEEVRPCGPAAQLLCAHQQAARLE